MAAPDFILSARRRDRILLLLLGVILLALALLSLCLGSSPLALSDIAQIIFQAEHADPVLKQILWDFRLPRILTAILAGAALSTAGLLMQTLFRNPLADPFVLGVNSGANLGVALMLLLFIPLHLEWGPTNLVWAVQHLSGRLSGRGYQFIVYASHGKPCGCAHITGAGFDAELCHRGHRQYCALFSQIEPIQSFIAWSFGDFSRVHWQQLILLGPILVFGLLLSISIAKPLDGLQQGDAFAMSLGVP